MPGIWQAREWKFPSDGNMETWKGAHRHNGDRHLGQSCLEKDSGTLPGMITVNAADTVILQDDAFLSTSSTGGVLAGAIRLDAANLKLSGSASVTSTSEMD